MSDSGSFFKRYFILTDLLQLHHGPLGDRNNLKLPLSKKTFERGSRPLHCATRRREPEYDEFIFITAGSGAESTPC